MKECNYSNITKIVDNLSQRSPFGTDPSLRNIASGVAEEGVNCNKAKEVGDKILSLMVGKNVHEDSFQKKQQVLTLASKTAVQFNDGKVQVDPQLLFQGSALLLPVGDMTILRLCLNMKCPAILLLYLMLHWCPGKQISLR